MSGQNPMNFRAYIWSAVGLIAVAYMLAALVKMLLPLLIVIAVVWGIYQLIFKKRW